jgi:putative methyltransferase (TIGR04325 family)
VRAIRRERYRRYFGSSKGFAMHSGVFRTFEEALAAAPSSAGFNQARSASDYADRLDRVFAYDYPVLFWLQRIFQESTSLRLLDIGGNIGVHYHAYKKFIDFPSQLKWRVAEVEEVAKAGRSHAQGMGCADLEFTTSFEDLDSTSTDIVLSAGALHYIDRPLLWDVIERAKSKPRNIILNKLPLYQGEDFVSLQNIGAGFSPLHVWNRQTFIARFEQLGYQLVDDWSVHERRFEIFDDPVRSFGPFSGLYLRQK